MRTKVRKMDADTYIMIDGLFDCEVEYNYHWENNGIGWYEFWGSTGYDAGTDYIVIDDILISDTSLSDEDRKYAEDYINENWEKICEEIIEKR